MRTKGPVLGLVGMVWLAWAASALADGRQYVHPADHYSLQLPEGWKEISQSSLGLLNRFAGRVDGRVKYITGFQRQDRPDLAYPYVLVQHHAFSPEPSMDELLAMVRRDLAPTIGRTTQKMAGLVGQTTVDPPSLDREHHRIYQPLAANVLMVGKVKGLSVMCVGKQGAVWLHGYAPEAEWPAFAPVFHTLVDSLKFEPGYGYDESLAQPSRWHFDGKGAFGGALVGLIVGGTVGALTAGALGLKKLFAKSASRPE